MAQPFSAANRRAINSRNELIHNDLPVLDTKKIFNAGYGDSTTRYVVSSASGWKLATKISFISDLQINFTKHKTDHYCDDDEVKSQLNSTTKVLQLLAM